MRWLCSLAAVVTFAAACKVNTRGMPCVVFDGCPDGEKCAADGICRPEAAGCTAWPDGARLGARRCTIDWLGSQEFKSKPDGSRCADWVDVTTCSAEDICVAGASTGCAPRYSITAGLPAPATQVVGPGGKLQVDIRVTRAPNVQEWPDGVTFTADTGPSPVNLTAGTPSGQIIPYTGDWVPAGVEGDVALTFTVRKGTNRYVESRSVYVDMKPPDVTLDLACKSGAPCLRDGTLGLTISVVDRNMPAPHDVTVTFDHLSSATVPASGGDISLGDQVFDAFQAPVAAHLTIADLYGNSTTKASLPVMVTRLRWAHDTAVAAGVSSPAVLADRTLWVGVNAPSDQLRHVGAAGNLVTSRTLTASGFTPKGVVAAPSAAGNSVAAGAEDGRLWGLFPSLAAPAPCPTGTGVQAGQMLTPVHLPQGSVETWISTGAAAALDVLQEAPACFFPAPPTVDPATALVASGGNLFVATKPPSGDSLVRRFEGGAGPRTDKVLSPCSAVDNPMAADAYGNLVVACSGGQIYGVDRVTLDSTLLFTLSSAPSTSPVVLSAAGPGDIVVGTIAGTLHRLTPGATGGPWTGLAGFSPPAMPGPIRAVAVAGGGTKPRTLYVVAGDQLFALDATTGAQLWASTSGDFGTGVLGFPTIAPPASASSLPTLYVGSSDGRLRAVVVEEPLDTLAPWPKAHRDLGNTGAAP